MRNFFLLLSFTTVSFLFAIFTGGEILYYIFFALSSILLLSILYSIIGRASIKLKVDIKDTEIHVGEKIRYKIKIKNKWFLPLIFIAIDEKNESFFPITTNLNPFQKKVIKRSIECKRRGIYKIGPVKIKLRDPFGIFEVKKTFNKKHKIIVYPNVYDISIELPAIAEIGRAEGKNKQYEDYTNLSNLREYINGDSLKRVHWRISAKLQKLYVKEYEYTASNEVFIIWDLYRQHYKEDYNGMIDEKTAECVLSIAKYCLANGVPVSLADYESNKLLARCKSIKDFSIFKLLTLKLFPTYDSDFNEKLLNNIRRVSRESTLAIITPYVDEKTVFTLSNINLHQNVIIFYTNKEPLEEEIKRKLDCLRIKFIPWGDKYEDIRKKVQYI